MDPVGVDRITPSQPNSDTGRPSISSTTSSSFSAPAFCTAASFSAQSVCTMSPLRCTTTSTVIRSSTS